MFGSLVEPFSSLLATAMLMTLYGLLLELCNSQTTADSNPPFLRPTASACYDKLDIEKGEQVSHARTPLRLMSEHQCVRHSSHHIIPSGPGLLRYTDECIVGARLMCEDTSFKERMSVTVIAGQVDQLLAPRPSIYRLPTGH